MRTVKEVRESFWNAHEQHKPEFRKTWKQNQYNATIRTDFSFYVDSLRRDEMISENLADRVTL